LMNLQILGLNSNKFEGNILAELRNLTRLWRLYLSNNLLIGSIPLTTGQLENLSHIFFQFNQITGPIPLEFENLKSLPKLYLSNNFINSLILPL